MINRTKDEIDVTEEMLKAGLSAFWKSYGSNISQIAAPLEDAFKAMLKTAYPVDSSWVDELVTRLPHVRPRFVEEVKLMPRSELQRRVLIGSDWQGSFACSLDGIPEISCMPGSGIDGCRMPQEVRAVVTQLVEECPKTWAKTWTGKMKDAAPDDSQAHNL